MGNVKHAMPKKVGGVVLHGHLVLTPLIKKDLHKTRGVTNAG